MTANAYSLAGKTALVIGIANEQSIAWGCAKAFHAQGARLAVTYLNDRAERHVRPLAEALEAEVIAPLDVRSEAQSEELFAALGERWGQLDILLHSIAFCPKQDLQSRVVDCSREGFLEAMDVSVHSFLRLVRRAEPLMREGSTCLTVSYFGAEKVIDHYNIMGPVKAALEAATRYLAVELGPAGISVHALSPGPMQTRAASGIEHFDELLEQAARRAPTGHLATLDGVGAYAAFLASAGAANATGGTHHIDGGYHIRG